MNTPSTVAKFLQRAVSSHTQVPAQARLDHLESVVQNAVRDLNQQVQPERLLEDLRSAIASTEHYIGLANKARDPHEWASRLSGATEVLKLRLELLADSIETRSNLNPKEPTAA